MTDSEGKLKLPDWIENQRESRAYLEGYNAGAEATAVSVRATLENATDRIAALEKSLAELQTQLQARGSGKRKVSP